MKRAAVIVGITALVVSLAAPATAVPHFSAWEPAQKLDEIAGNSSEINMPFLDGCPIQSPDGLSLYLASDRPKAWVGWTSGSRIGRPWTPPSARP